MPIERAVQDKGIDIGGLPAVPPVGELDTLCRQARPCCTPRRRYSC
jgi:hypothetical protein